MLESSRVALVGSRDADAGYRLALQFGHAVGPLLAHSHYLVLIAELCRDRSETPPEQARCVQHAPKGSGLIGSRVSDVSDHCS